MIEIETPSVIRAIVNAASNEVGRQNVDYRWQVFPATNVDRAKRLEVVISILIE